MRKKILIPKKELQRLYYKEKKSKYKIGEIYNCSFKTVLNRMREFDMKPLSRSIIQSRYFKNDFSENNIEKAYLIGFRLGDLNVYKTANHSEVIVVRCHTTRKEQVQLIKKIFSKYGKVSYKTDGKNNSFHVNCFLNNSFEFLLPKEDNVVDWIIEQNIYSSAFAAGYIDAEGNFGVYSGRARFKIDSYDKNIILWFSDWLRNNNILFPSPRKIASKGYVYNKKFGYKYNKDLWRITVNSQESLLKLFGLIGHYLKHKKRIIDFNKCLKNLNERKQIKI